MSEDVPKIAYLFREKDRGWTFRRRVPADVQWAFDGRAEHTEALRARDHREAINHRDQALAKFNMRVADARGGRLQRPEPGSVRNEPPPVIRPEATEAVFRQALLHWFHQQERVAVAEDRQIVESGDADAVAQELLADRTHLSGDDGAVQAEKLARKVLGIHGFSLPTGKLRQTAVELFRAGLVEGVRRSQERLGDRARAGEGDPDRLFGDVTALREAPPPPAAPEPTHGSLPPLKAEDLLNRWAAERRPSPATRRKYATTFGHLIRILGFDDVRRITEDNVVSFKQARLADGRDPGTVADDVLAAGAVCKWAVTNRMLPSNPFAGRAPRVTRHGPAPVLPYDDDEAARLLTAARAETGWLRWGPWLLCFTGARIGELAELRRGNVKTEGGVWFLDIVPTEARAGKNAIMQRMIPLHPAVLGEGFLDYVAALPTDPNGPLFPSIRPDPRDGRVTPATTTMARWVHGKVKITTKGKVPAHSWRHRMQDELLKVNARREVIDAITGRNNPLNAGDHYGYGLRRMPWETVKELAKIPSPVGTVESTHEEAAP